MNRADRAESSERPGFPANFRADVERAPDLYAR